MRKLFSALLLTLVATNATAFSTQTQELLSTIAMPLAVAAVSRVTGVPATQLSSLVSTLNQANVPPAQFVNVMRYTPVALVDNNGQPFVAYVETQVSQGVTGDALASAIVQQLQTQYNVTPQPATFIVADNYIPPTLLTNLGSTNVAGDAFSVIALPLAVAAVADITGMPQDQLANLVATLNNANVPPAQIIEVVRYVPVALIDNGQPFVQYVQQQVSQGITGPALVPVIERQLQPYYPSTRIRVTAPRLPIRTVVVDQNFLPPFVVRRVAEVRQHPHGGPPGQIKKQLGLQTGAEVVHREARNPGPGRGHEKQRQVVVTRGAPLPPPMAQPRMIVPRQPAPVVAGAGHGHGRGPDGNGPPGQNKGKGNGNGHGHGKGKGKD